MGYLKNATIAWVLRGAIEGDGIRRKIVVRKIDKMMEEKMGKKSWKTTLGGVSAILGGVSALAAIAKKISDEGIGAINGDTLTAASLAWASVSGGVALLFARDNKVSSEQAGAGNVPPKTSPAGDQ